MKRKAFTLIELLVVIAIIAILAAILFPVFSQAKAAAQKTACLSNTKQIGVGLYLYLNDSDDTLPMANYDATYKGPPFTAFAWQAGSGKAGLNWADIVQPYAKSTKVFKCPVDSSGPALDASNKAVTGELLSYALNYYFYRLPGGIANFSLTGGSLSSMTAPAAKIFIAESASNSSREIVRPDRYAGFERHGGGANYVMADTHAKFHLMPQAWKTVPTSTWSSPELASQQPWPQWFPWVDGEEKW